MKNSTKNVVFAGGGLFVLSLVAYISYCVCQAESA